MRILRNALCTVRSTAVIVVVLMSTFILFDSYTHQLFSSWSKSMSPESIFSSSAANPSISSSWVPPIEYRGNLEPPEEGSNFNSGSQAENEDYQEEAEEMPQEQLGVKHSPAKSGDISGSQSGANKESYEYDTALATMPALDVLPPHPEGRKDQYGGRSTVINKPESPSGRKESLRETTAATSADTTSQVEAPSTLPDHLTESKRPSGYRLTSIQKVELDLWQARAALRRVAVAQMNADDRGEPGKQVADDESASRVYKNAALFHQSYMEMENRFKVFIYQEGEEPLVHDGPCKEIYAIEGRFIQELHDNNPFVTSDPEQAHVFFLPFSVAMMVTYLYTANSGDMSPLLRFVQDYVHVVSDKYSYWNRSEGSDHFMLSCHDWGPYVSRVDDNLYTKTIRVLCNANRSEGYIPVKDVSLPEINLVGGEVPTDLGGLPVNERIHLAFFAGADHGPVRPQLFEYWEGKDGDLLVYRAVPAGGKSYYEFMKSSKFCICPGGYEVNSPRIVEALYNDCIPVIIADEFVLPFSDVLDWTTFSLQVVESDIADLKTILEAFPLDELIRMQRRVKQVKKHFIFNQPIKKHDVFHMILHSVWLRRLNFRLPI